MFEKFIYEKHGAVSNELCKSIIDLFDSESTPTYNGVTAKGHVPHIKSTIDYAIPPNALFDNDSSWNPICKALNESLKDNIIIYLKSLNNSHPHFIETNYKFISADYLSEETYQIQRYKKGEGKYVYHEDFNVKWESRQYRVITFLWYLNTVDEGGETEIMGSMNIKPEAGKLLLFPASWTFPHRGKMPISQDKYIVTGWFHVSSEITD